MRLLLAIALVATPALAQGVIQSQARGYGDSNAALWDHRSPPRLHVPVSTVLKAGAWGRCVVAAEPVLARDYVDARADNRALKATFGACHRRTGDFTGFDRDDVRRAALTDALRS